MAEVVAKTPTESCTEKTELLLPQYANALGTAFGGTIMSWIDIAAAVAAQRHCGRVAVTASVDQLNFLAPIHVGDIVQIGARLTAAFRTSMEVWVQVFVEDSNSKNKRRLCVESWLTFVNLDENEKPLAVPELRAENEQDEIYASEAKARRAARLAAKKEMLASR